MAKTIQDELRGPPFYHEAAARHIDRLEADKAGLVEALEARAVQMLMTNSYRCTICDQSGARRGHFNHDPDCLIAKHKRESCPTK